MDTNQAKSKFYRIGLPIIVAILAAAIVVLSTFLGIYAGKSKHMGRNIENLYSQAYYQLLESNLRLENNLFKLDVISSPRLAESTLVEIAKDAETASCAINTMASGDELLRPMVSFYNQLGDYHTYLLRLVTKSGALSDNDKETVRTFAERSRNIGKKLNGLRDKMDKNFKFSAMLKDAQGDWAVMIGDLSVNQGKYPALIYDGPFSDGVEEREPKAISGEQLSHEQLLDKARKYLADESIIGITISGVNYNRIPSAIIVAELSNERKVTLEIAIQGGMLLMLDEYKAVTEPNLSGKECTVLAEQYCAKIGINDMQAVWIQVNNSIAYVNLCSTIEGTILYPDMVKIKISMDTGSIVGFEGLSYAYNHTVRELPTPTLSKEDAMLAVNKGLTDLSCRLALIPMTEQTEVLCYEISGMLGEERYFIYVDVLTHDEVSILRVIDSNQGELLM